MGERTTLLLSEILKATGIKEAARDVKVSFEGPAQSRKLEWKRLKDKDGDVEFTVLESFDALKLRLESDEAAYILVLKKAVVKEAEKAVADDAPAENEGSEEATSTDTADAVPPSPEGEGWLPRFNTSVIDNAALKEYN